MQSRKELQNRRNGGWPENVEHLPTVQWRETKLPEWATSADRFAVSEVCGDSLAEVGINDGDYVLIHLTPKVREGDLIAVNTPQGFLIKFLAQITTDYVYLYSSRLSASVAFPIKSTRIEGRVIRKTA